MEGRQFPPQSESGEGRALEPAADGVYQIATAEELRAFAEKVNDGETTANAVLTANIDLNNQPWYPIGSEDHLYTGTFDGRNFKISGLTIDSSSADYQGLFGHVGSSGKVQNLTVSGTVIGRMKVGGIAGQNLGNVINCAFSGSVKGSGSIVGGVVGHNYIGGSVTNSYNTGEVSGSDHVGGVVGQNNGPVTGCYFLKTDDVNENLSGIGGGSAEGAKSLTADQFKNQNSFTDWDFSDTWRISQSQNRPVLQANAEDNALSGTGNQEDPYKIYRAIDLKNFRDLVNGENGNPAAWAVLMNDINLSSVCGESNSWTPIGTSEEKAYTGTFDGNGHKIENLYINTTDSRDDNQGLFGYVSGTVQNLTVDGTVSGDWHVGGVVGYNNGGTVTGCIFSDSGTVTGSSYVGGVVGLNLGNVINCAFSGSVTGSDHVGGVVGDNFGGVKNCYNTGTVTSSGTPVGGVVGYNDISGSVTNCYNTGTVTVTGTDDYLGGVGGVVGQNFGGTVENSYNTGTGTVTNCYNTGAVSDGVDVGGVVGWNSSSGTVTNCYNTGAVSDGVDVGGVVGWNSSSGTVTNCYNTGAVSDGVDVGGVVGWNSSSGTVTNCYNTGAVSDGVDVGGVVGYNFGGTVENCYNTGTVSDGTTSGGVVGQNSGSVTNCYYQNDKASAGIGGSDSETDEAIAKDNTAFHSGEVAWLLQKGQKAAEGEVVPLVWGQSKLGETTSLPTLVALDKNAKTVYQVTLKYDHAGAQDKTYYTDDTATPSEQPSREGYTFGGWQKTTGEGNTITFTAIWTKVEEPTPEPEPEEPPYTGRYSYEITTDTSDNGTLSVDRYATEGDKVTITVTPDEAYKLDDLSVTANGKDVELTANGDGTYTFTMPSADVKISATFAEDPDWTEPEEPATDVSNLFIDIAPDAWYKDAVQYAYDNGLMTGVSATEFAPEQTTTRAMIVSILARLENVTTAEAAGFADVDDNDWYATAVNWAANVGVVNGYEDNTFRPNTAITREQLAAILMNYAAYKGEDVSARADLTSYTDQPSTWAQEAMQWAVAEGLISGVTNDQLQPQSSATRAQVAAILQRLLEA